VLQELAWRVDRATVVVDEQNLPDNASVPDLDDSHDMIIAPTAGFAVKARPP
jgi:hypothetical protein